MNAMKNNTATANKINKVAQFANKKLRKSKGEKRLDERINDFTQMMSVKNGHGGIQQRKETGGFHKPGSLQRS